MASQKAMSYPGLIGTQSSAKWATERAWGLMATTFMPLALPLASATSRGKVIWHSWGPPPWVRFQVQVRYRQRRRSAVTTPRNPHVARTASSLAPPQSLPRRPYDVRPVAPTKAVS